MSAFIPMGTLTPMGTKVLMGTKVPMGTLVPRGDFAPIGPAPIVTVPIYTGGTVFPSGWAANGGALVYAGVEVSAETSLLTLDTQSQQLDGHFDLTPLPNLPVFKCNGGLFITKVLFPPVVPGGAGMLYRLGSNQITQIDIGTVPDTADIDLEDNALPQAEVDNILVTLAAGTAIDGVLNLTAGTNATPSATGLTAKGILQGRGWTVTNN